MPWWACFGVIWNQSKELKRNSDSLILNIPSFDNFCIKNVKNTKKKDERETEYVASFFFFYKEYVATLNTMYPSVLKHKYLFN